MEIESGRAFYFISGHTPDERNYIGTLYDEYKEIDGFLSIVMCCGKDFVLQPRFLHGYVEPEKEEMNGPER